MNILPNPINLVDVPVKVKMVTNNGDNPAWVEKKGSVYHILIDSVWLLRMMSKSEEKQFKNFIKLGLIYHEVAHIKYNSFSYNRNYEDNIHMWIDNVIEDVRIEYKLSCNYALAAKFLALVFSTLPRIGDVYLTNNIEKEKFQSKKIKLKKYLDDLFLITRCGVIKQDMDEKFVSFVVPQILVAMRGNRKTARKVADNIYKYLMVISGVKTDFNDSFFKKIGVDFINVSENWLDEQLKNETEKVIQIDGDSTFKIVDEIKQEFDKQNNNSGNAARKIEDEVAQILEAIEEKSKFYNSVCLEYSNEINTLTNVLRSIITKYKDVHVKEGDINIKRMQNAYLNSIIGEEGRDYLQKRVEHVGFDCVIFRDTSGSTTQFKWEYVKSLIIVAEALNNIKVRTAIIDFNSNPTIVKLFDEDKDAAKFRAESTGNTRLGAAMISVKRFMNWKNDKRVGFIITDGCFSDDRIVHEMMQDPIYKDVNWIVILIGSCVSVDVFSNITKNVVKIDSVKKLPEVVANVIKNIN